MKKKLFDHTTQLLSAFFFLEILLRLAGFPPFVANIKNVKTIPENYLIPDQKLGYTLREGRFKTNFQDQIFSTKRHPIEGQRATSLSVDSFSKGKIQLYGCSFTYGYNLSDQETMAWRLQEKLPAKNIQNHGIPGFGLTQVYLKLKQELESGNIPEKVIINYASFHDERNILSRNWRKQTVPFFKNQQLAAQIEWPKVAGNSHLSVSYQKLTYSEWPLMRYSSAIHLFECGWNWIAAIFQDGRASSRQLFRELVTLRKKYEFQILVTGMMEDNHTKQMLFFCESIDIPTLDLSLDLKNEEYSWYPLDMHPNAKANSIYADKLYLRLGKLN